MAFLGCPEGFGKKLIATMWVRETDLKPCVAMERCLPRRCSGGKSSSLCSVLWMFKIDALVSK